MDIILASNGKSTSNSALLSYAYDAIAAQIKRTHIRDFLLIPYALVNKSYDQRVTLLNQSLNKLSIQVKGIHEYQNPVEAVNQAGGIIVSGGNTFLLNKTLHAYGLITPLRRKIITEKHPYIGWSAGSNIAGPNICTTNDMPIIPDVVMPSLGFIPFQLNPHYTNVTIPGHMGETRDVRLLEFIAQNQDMPVVAIEESCALSFYNDTIEATLKPHASVRLFQYPHTEPVVLSHAELLKLWYSLR